MRCSGRSARSANRLPQAESGDSPPRDVGYDRDMPTRTEPRARRQAIPLRGIALVAFVVLLGAVSPADPGAPSVRTLIEGGGAGTGGGGGGTDLLAGLGPLLLVVLVIAGLLATIAAIILFRTRSTAPAGQTEGWWTCTRCDAANMDGAARCHACSTWRATTPRTTPSASP